MYKKLKESILHRSECRPWMHIVVVTCQLEGVNRNGVSHVNENPFTVSYIVDIDDMLTMLGEKERENPLAFFLSCVYS